MKACQCVKIIAEILVNFRGYLKKMKIQVSILSLFLPFSAIGQSPNILLILVDDLGYGDLSCMGGEDIHTPHIDELFQMGIRFNNFYANSSVCSPTRASLLTGRYPDMVGVPGVIRSNQNESWGYLHPDAVMLPEMLSIANYHTAIIGKWHLGLESPNTPNERGFDLFHGFLGGMMNDYWTHLQNGNNYMRLNDKEITPKGHATDIFSDWSIAYFKQRKKETEPFFLYLAYNAPHYPIQPPQEWLEKVKKREVNISEKRANNVAFVEHLDDNIGRVISALEKTGQFDNTLIIFCSDNGGKLEVGASNGDLRGEKEDMYEGGIKSPACFVWKDKIKANSVSDNLALTMDVFPTVCDVANIDINHDIDGISLLPTLLGKHQITDDRTVFWMRRGGYMKYGGKAYYAARYKDYKLLQNTPWEPMQFFNIKTDFQEKKALEKEGSEYVLLFRNLMQHINESGAIPWGD